MIVIEPFPSVPILNWDFLNLETPMVPNSSAEIVRSETLWMSTATFANCLFTVLTFPKRTRLDPEPIPTGLGVTWKSDV